MDENISGRKRSSHTSLTGHVGLMDNECNDVNDMSMDEQQNSVRESSNPDNRSSDTAAYSPYFPASFRGNETEWILRIRMSDSGSKDPHVRVFSFRSGRFIVERVHLSVRSQNEYKVTSPFFRAFSRASRPFF